MKVRYMYIGRYIGIKLQWSKIVLTRDGIEPRAVSIVRCCYCNTLGARWPSGGENTFSHSFEGLARVCPNTKSNSCKFDALTLDVAVCHIWMHSTHNYTYTYARQMPRLEFNLNSFNTLRTRLLCPTVHTVDGALLCHCVRCERGSMRMNCF